MNLTVLFLTIYLLFIFFLIVGGYFAQRMRETSYVAEENEGIDVSELIVIVPFRNEEKRIHRLLNSINELHSFPKEFIFVNDHSEDATVALVEGLRPEVPYRIVHLENGEEGKKTAIRKAIQDSSSTTILTIDADIELQPLYFAYLGHLDKADMYILPAILKAEKPLEYLFEVDLLLVMAVNMGLAGWTRPILASGANLLFSRIAFEKHDRLASHAHMPSGDDIYLLRDFRKGKASVRLMTDSRLAIYTETPKSWQEFIHQRLRWIAKTGDVKDGLSTGLAILQAFFTFVFVGIVTSLLISGETKSALMVFFVKTGIDVLAFLPFFNRSKRLVSWLFIPFYEILFPIYTVIIAVMMYTFKPTWKGRKLDRNF